MADFFGNDISLRQTQQLSVAQMQYLRLLQMNTLELNSYLNELQLENPLIEVQSPEALMPDDASPAKLAGWIAAAGTYDTSVQPDDGEGSVLEAVQSDDGTLYSLEEYLKNQIDLSVDGEEYRMLDYLIGRLDANGYLTVTSEHLADKFSCDISLASEAIAYLQTLDPPGIGAHDLSECLRIQLLRLSVAGDDAMALCSEEVLLSLAHGHFKKVSKSLGISVDRISALYSVIRTLTPRPASAFGGERAAVIAPDVSIDNKDGTLRCTFNSRYSAKVSVTRDYLSLADEDPAARDYINRKMSQALWIVGAIESRQDTIEHIVSVITEVQRDFFADEGGPLRPLRLVDVAERIGVHESTVSRAISEKYLQCRRGTFPIKYFFSAAVPGGDDVSSRSVKAMIQKAIAEENSDSPLSDSALCAMLEEKGIHIARRTAAKYREELGIPSSNARKVRQ